MTGFIRDLIWDSDQDPAHSRPVRPLALYVLLAVVVLVLGLNWPIMAIGLESISPIWMGVFRLGGGTVAIVAVAGLSGRLRLPPRADLPIVASLAVFRLVAVTLLVFLALEIIPPGRSSVVAWTTPLWTVPIAAIFLGDRMNRRRWVGLALGIAGVVSLFEPWALDWGDADIVRGHVMLVGASIVNASSAVHIRGHRWTITPLDALPWQLSGATLMMLTLALVVDGAPSIAWSPVLTAIVAYQGVLASGIALWAQIVVLRNIDPVSANLTMMGVPAVGLASSAMILGELITFELALGLALVVAGVAVNLLGERVSPGLRGVTEVPG